MGLEHMHTRAPHIVALGVLEVLFILNHPTCGRHTLSKAAAHLHGQAELRAIGLAAPPRARHHPTAAEIPAHVPIKNSLPQLVAGTPRAPKGEAAVSGGTAHGRLQVSVPMLDIVLLANLTGRIAGFL